MARWNQFSVLSLLIAVALSALILYVFRSDSQRSLSNPALLQGRVVYGYNGKPAPGVVVHAQRVSGQEPYGFGRVLTNVQGRYQMPKLPAGDYNIWAESDGFTVKALANFGCYGAEQAPDLRLVRGGIIAGRIIDAATGRPVRIPASSVGLHGPSRPESGSGIASAPVMNDGTFFIRAAPGRNYVYLRWVRTDLKLPTEAWVEVKEGETVAVELKAPSEK